MKKRNRFLSFAIAIMFILPCLLLLSGCGKFSNAITLTKGVYYEEANEQYSSPFNVEAGKEYYFKFTRATILPESTFGFDISKNDEDCKHLISAKVYSEKDLSSPIEGDIYENYYVDFDLEVGTYIVALTFDADLDGIVVMASERN